MEWKTGCTDPPIGPSPYVATLTFDMASTEGRKHHKLATGALDMARALHNAHEDIRRIKKYDAYETMTKEEIVARIYAIIADAINSNCRETLEAYQ